MPLTGGTDVYVGLHFGSLPGRRFLSLWGLPGLRAIRLRKDTLVIGALATYTDLIESPLVRRRLPFLGEASRWVGSPQIQNRGTLGGNLANASPAGDTLPVLAVAEAVIVLRSVDGERRVPFDSFYTGYRQTVMHADELTSPSRRLRSRAASGSGRSARAPPRPSPRSSWPPAAPRSHGAPSGAGPPRSSVGGPVDGDCWDADRVVARGSGLPLGCSWWPPSSAR